MNHSTKLAVAVALALGVAACGQKEEPKKAAAAPAAPAGLPPPLAKPAGPAVNAWVCEGVTCMAPIAVPGQLRETLKGSKIPGSAPTPTRTA